MPLDAFHFLRPWWLLGLVPVALVALAAWRGTFAERSGGWQDLVDPHLLRHLVPGTVGAARSRWSPVALVVAFVATTLALAGPAWERRAMPATDTEPSTVIVLSLAQSMNATDVAPSRLGRAEHKVRDVLARSRGANTGFVVYADRPFTAAPLTSDGQVIAEMLPELSTALMPVLGNRLELAIDEASTLLERAGAPTGRILVLADDAGVDPEAAVAAAKRAVGEGYRVSVLGVGTDKGSGLQTADGRSITRSGEALETRLERADLERLASAGGGRFATLTGDDADLDTLLTDASGRLSVTGSGSGGADAGVHEAAGRSGEATASGDALGDAWQDEGWWLLLVPLLLAPLAFRRHVLFALPLGIALAFGGAAPEASAAGLDSLWRTPDQQAAEAFDSGAFDAAADTFDDADWRASALYRAGRYKDAAASYAGTDSPDADFNRGNALAKAGELEAAIEAYDLALERRPADEDAAFNRELVVTLLEQQHQQQQQQQQEDQDEQDRQDGQGRQSDQGQQGQPGERSEQGRQGDRGQQGQPEAQGERGKQGDQARQGRSTEQGDRGRQGEQGRSGEQNGQGQSGEQGQGDPQEQDPQGRQGRTDRQGDGNRQAEQARPNGPGDGDSASGRSADPADADGERAATAGSGTETEERAVDDERLDDGEAPGDDVFRDAMDTALERERDGAGDLVARSGAVSDEADELTDEPTAGGGAVLDQASEQQLRAVPDDPSGLLRSRIRQHYLRLRQGGSG